MGFSWQEYWSGLPFPPLGDLPDPEIESVSPPSPELAVIFFTHELLGNPSRGHWTSNAISILSWGHMSCNQLISSNKWGYNIWSRVLLTGFPSFLLSPKFTSWRSISKMKMSQHAQVMRRSEMSRADLLLVSQKHKGGGMTFTMYDLCSLENMSQPIPFTLTTHD